MLSHIFCFSATFSAIRTTYLVYFTKTLFFYSFFRTDAYGSTSILYRFIMPYRDLSISARKRVIKSLRPFTRLFYEIRNSSYAAKSIYTDIRFMKFDASYRASQETIGDLYPLYCIVSECSTYVSFYYQIYFSGTRSIVAALH